MDAQINLYILLHSALLPLISIFQSSEPAAKCEISQLINFDAILTDSDIRCAKADIARLNLRMRDDSIADFIVLANNKNISNSLRFIMHATDTDFYIWRALLFDNPKYSLDKVASLISASKNNDLDKHHLLKIFRLLPSTDITNILHHKPNNFGDIVSEIVDSNCEACRDLLVKVIKKIPDVDLVKLLKSKNMPEEVLSDMLRGKSKRPPKNIFSIILKSLDTEEILY